MHNFLKDYDENRDEVLHDMGLRVLRIKNEELNNLEEVKKRILEF